MLSEARYPRWLNVISVIVLAAVPFGILIAFIWDSQIGIAITGIGFLGIWVFGTYASRYRRALEE